MNDTTEDAPRALGDRIVTLRQAAGATQLDLATRAGISISSVYRAEGGMTISARTAGRLAMALGVEPSQIYAGGRVVASERPVSVSRAEEQHSEVIGRLDAIQDGVDRLQRHERK